MCGRVNRSGTIPTSGMRGAGGSSVIIEGSLIAGSSAGKPFSTDVLLEEVAGGPVAPVADAAPDAAIFSAVL